METKLIPDSFDHYSPAGAQVRVLMNNKHGGIAHCTLKREKVSKAVCHKTVSEFWHISSGSGEIWRKKDEKEIITSLKRGITIDIPVGTEFQYRSHHDDLIFICVTNPPWPGADEVRFVEKGAWKPS